MLSRKTKKITTIVASLAILTTMMAGCGTKTATSNVAQELTYNLGADPKTIDPALNDAVDGASVITNAFDGLTVLNDKDIPVAGIAKSWKISDDQKTYTFTLRDAKWSDGKPVKAQDFEYAWKRALDPKTATDYAYYLFYLKNGEAFNSGAKGVTAADVGVKATDDKTLVVTLEEPTPYFLSLTAFPTYSPVREDIVASNPNWWQDPKTYIVDGPYKLDSYKPKDKLVFVKNPDYWNASSIKLNKITYTVLDQETSYMASFRNKQLDIIESPPSDEIPALVKAGTAKIMPMLGTYYIEFNLTANAAKVDAKQAAAIQNVKVREALNLAIDRTKIVQNVTKGGQTPAFSFVPKGIPEGKSGKDFASKQYFDPKGDVAKAKQLLADAGYPDGKGFPKLTYLYNTAQGHQDIAVAIQAMWKQNLGIDVELKNQEWAVFQTTRTSKNYIVARAGWIADYTDPMTFLDLFTSKSGNNDPGYNNANYDSLIAQSKTETDATKRMALLHQAEDQLMTDMPVVPIYYYTNVVCMQPKVQNVHVSSLGFVVFRDASVK